MAQVATSDESIAYSSRAQQQQQNGVTHTHQALTGFQLPYKQLRIEQQQLHHQK